MRVRESCFLLVAFGCNSTPTAPAPAAAASSPEVPPASLTAIAGAHPERAAASFTRRLAAATADGQSGNFCVSPSSLHAALAMVRAGARGETERELSALLGSVDDEARGFGVDAGTEYSVPTVRVGNRVFVQRGAPLLPAYLEQLRVQYGAQPVSLDFATQPERSRIAINDFVASATERMIGTMLAVPLPTATRLAVMSAVFFRAPWTVPFAITATANESFTTATGTIPTPMMHATAARPLGTTAEADWVELRYGDPRASLEYAMLLAVPKQDLGLPALERTLRDTALDPWDTARREQPVDLALPRFRIESELSLTAILAALGVHRLFSPATADLSGIDGTRSLYLDQVKQRTLIEVDEKGTEAGAATVIAAKIGAAYAEPVVVRADHPFLFFIRHIPTRTTLFWGRVVRPGGP